MIPKKLYFLIYFLFILSLQSCKEETKPIPEKKSNLAEIKRLITLGDHYYESSKYDSSYYYFNKAKIACNPEKDAKHYIYSISNLATIQQNQGDFSGSEATAMEAMPILESTTNPNFKWNIYTILGINYLNTFDYENASYYFTKAQNLNVANSRKYGALNNLAQVYLANDQNNTALSIFHELLEQEKIINDPRRYSKALSNIGYCYNKMQNSKAITFLDKSLKIRLETKDQIGLIASYYNLSNFYKERNPKLAIKYLDFAYLIATKINSIDDRIGCLKSLIELSEGSSLKKHSLSYIHINDSITKVRQQAKNQFAKMKYDSKKGKEEILKLKAQKAENELQLQLQKNTTLNLYFAVGIILTVTGFTYFYLIEKSKREKFKTSYDTEVRIAKKLHDELANDVYQTMVFTETHDLSKSNNRDLLLDKLDTIYSRTRNISKENSIIPMGIDFLPNLKEMISGFNTTCVTIMIHGADTIDWQALSDIKKITVYRILQELLINMKKHSKATLAVISFKKGENNLHLNYTDNGTGVTIEKVNLKNGLQNMENRILAIKGTISFDTKPSKGFKSTVIFPL